MPERNCGYRIVAFIDSKREIKFCNPKKECLRDRVWNGKGVKAAAAFMLNRESIEGIEAYVEGKCLKLQKGEKSIAIVDSVKQKLSDLYLILRSLGTTEAKVMMSEGEK